MNYTIGLAALIVGAATLVGSLPDKTLYVAEAVEKPVDSEVEIEAEIEWTPERVEEEIRKVFPDAPIMLAVARCESSLIPDAEGPTNDGGVFQIHRPSHAKRIEGIDLYNPAQNIRFARELYEESGLAPWRASRHCWSK